ncbi:hypothetical protein AMS68_001133 [Peltaster fructicola]|uniref:Uncharacterized protein n=1 Tax=Peltaster fructicola TaxID=286661 RepID=A0A6H0XLN4_9PEZI|nr:hypothetical protein AMS68_001133 [Peltaster fructicola]
MASIDGDKVVVERHIYNKGELERYFDRIALSSSKRIYDASILSDDEKLDYLSLLQKHELCKVPWENTVQHYSFHRTVNVRAKYLYRKIVNNPGRGGYCMEANYFFHLILVALKFDAYIVGSRIYNPDTKRYGGWTHCVNIVTVAGTRYLLDGGLGPNGPDRPIPIEDGAIVTQIASVQQRLTYETVSQHLDRTQKVWVFSYRYDETREWVPVYCFIDIEFFPEDIESMNFSPWLNPRTFFTHKVVCVRFTTDRENGTSPGSPDEAALEGDINGTMTLNQDVFKWRKNGRKVVELKLKTEQERVDVLKQYFGIELTDEEQESILGTSAEIGASALGSSELT